MDPTKDKSNKQVSTAGQAQPAPVPATSNQPHTASHQHAAANVIRGQLDAIYDGGSGENTPHTTPVATPPVPTPPTPPMPAAPTTADRAHIQPHALRTAPTVAVPKRRADGPAAPGQSQTESAYHRTMDTNLQDQNAEQKSQWEQYHSAWQRYYQLYYERYYAASLAKQRQSEQQIAAKMAETASVGDVEPIENGSSLTKAQAILELRDAIRRKVATGAQKVKKSRHFVPIMAGLVVLIFFTFLQYNRVLFGAVAAYATPGSADPQNIIADPMVEVDVGPEPKMIIPKINIDAPVVYGSSPQDAPLKKAMEKGIAHFAIAGANAVPGQIGNAVFAAHSSNDVFAAGDYKFVFAQNEKLTTGDIIYMNYEGKRYTYSITSKEVVKPEEVSKVQIKTDKPMLTLVSCVPLGTAEKRLLVFAEQISPDPSKAKSSNSNNDSAATQSDSNIPGKPEPTLLERLFGAS